MIDQKLLTAFLAVTTLAVLIQTGIVVGLWFVSNKMSRQADKALELTRNLVGPVHKSAANLQTVADRIAEYSHKAQSWLKSHAA